MSDVKEPKPGASGGQAPQVPSGLALTALNPLFREHPHQVLEQLRAAEPVHRDRQFDRVILTRFEDVRAVTGDRSLAVNPMKSRPGSFSRVLLGLDRAEAVFEPSMLHSSVPSTPSAPASSRSPSTCSTAWPGARRST